MGDEIDDSALDFGCTNEYRRKYLEQRRKGCFFRNLEDTASRDRIRQTAFEMIPEDERDAFYLKDWAKAVESE
jgi:hypothetical protein